MEENIIAIDDDDIAIVILKRMIASINTSLSIISFRAGQEALQHLKAKKYKNPPYVFLDFHLKDVVGWELIEELDTIPELKSKVFLISSSVSSDLPSISQKYKCVAGFIEKPITFEHLRSILEKTGKD